MVEMHPRVFVAAGYLGCILARLKRSTGVSIGARAVWVPERMSSGPGHKTSECREACA